MLRGVTRGRASGGAVGAPVIHDPGEELVRLVQDAGEEPSAVQRRAAALVRRRFGLALPPPFASPPRSVDDAPIRPATPHDGASIAAVRWCSARAVLLRRWPDAASDQPPVQPPIGHWASRAGAPPSPGHLLVVAGRRGEVHGVGEAVPGPVGGLGGAAGEVTLHVSPDAGVVGLWGALLRVAVEHLRAHDAGDARLWLWRDDIVARQFHEAHGWAVDGGERGASAAMTGDGPVEVRYRLAPRSAPGGP